MAQWKYAQHQTNQARYVYFKEGVAKKLTVTDWDFSKGKPYLFRCYVSTEDGEAVDKMWMVWDYESAMALKKRLGVKYTAPKEVTVVMRTEDDESTFKIS